MIYVNTEPRNQKRKKNWRSAASFQRERVENYLDFEKLEHLIQHGLQGLVVENIEGKLTEANDRINHIL